MRRVLCAVLMSGSLCTAVLAATIRSEAVKIEQWALKAAGDVFQITYTLDEFDFPQNRELDIRFDAALYAHLWGVNAPPGLDVVLLQPNNPAGASGDISALALVDLPNGANKLSVMARMVGNNRPGPQEYVISQLDERGIILSTISSGLTISSVSSVSSVPEPASMPAAFMALLATWSAAAIRHGWRRA